MPIIPVPNPPVNEEKPSPLPWILLILVLLLIIGLLLWWLLGQNDTPAVVTPTTGTTVSPTQDTAQIQAYYEEISTIVSRCRTAESEDVQTEQEISTDITDRGLDGEPIYSCFGMDGVYYTDEAVDAASGKLHPVYTVEYTDANGNLWFIEMINGGITATPLSYLAESDREVPLVLSESETVRCYDSESGMFYEIIPNSDVMRIITVERIDGDTLASFTKEVLDSYE